MWFTIKLADLLETRIKTIKSTSHFRIQSVSITKALY